LADNESKCCDDSEDRAHLASDIAACVELDVIHHYKSALMDLRTCLLFRDPLSKEEEIALAAARELL
jgi:hypothetical protein